MAQEKKVAKGVFEVLLDDKASKEMDKLSGKIADGSKKLLGLAGVGAAAATSALALLTKRSMEQIRQLRILSEVGDTTVGVLSRQSYAVNLAGIETEKYADILKDVKDRVGDFIQTGGGPMADFFEKIAPKVGVTADQFKSLSGPDALQLYVSSLEAANVSQAEMTFYLEAMAGDTTRLLPLLRDGGAEMRRLSEEAERLGLAVSDVDAAKVEEAQESIIRVGKVAEGLGNTLATHLSPIISALADELTDMAVEQDGFQSQVQEGMTHLAAGVAFGADAIHGIGVAFKAVKLIGAGFFSVMMTFIDELNKRFVGFQIKTIEAINALAEASNRLLGTDFKSIDTSGLEAWRDKVSEFANSSREKVGELRTELHEAAMQPMPGDKVLAWFQKVQEEAQKTAEATAAARAAQGGDEGSVESGMSDAEREQLQGRLEQVSMFMASETEKLEYEHEKRLAILNEGLAAKELSEAEHRKLTELLEADHQKRLNEIIEKSLTDREKFEKMSAVKQTKTVLGAIIDQTSGLAQHSRKMFELNKAAAIANAVLSLPSHVSETMGKYPYPLSIVMGALAAASSLAQIQAIKSTSFQGGGGGTTPSKAGSTPTINGQPVQSRGPSSTLGGSLQEETERRRQLEDRRVLDVEGIADDDVLTGRGVRKLIAAINKEAGDNVHINVRAGVNRRG